MKTRTFKEIIRQLGRALESRENGSSHLDASYEEGVFAALDWVILNTDREPIQFESDEHENKDALDEERAIKFCVRHTETD